VATPRSEPVDVHRLVAGCDVVAWRDFPGLPGVRVGVRPLAPADYDSLRRCADPVARREATRELIARTLVTRNHRGEVDSLFSIDDLCDADAPLVDALESLVDEAHAASFSLPPGVTPTAVADAISTWADARGMWIERARARHAPGIVAYFGLPSARHATTWQVLAFASLVTAEESP